MLTTVAPNLGRLALRAQMARRGGLYRPRMYGLAARVAGRAIVGAWRRYSGRKRRGYPARITNPYNKKRARFSTRMVGMPNGATTSKSTVIANETLIARNTRTLYNLDLTALAQGIAINQRLRQHTRMSGFKICMEVNSSKNNPLYFNVAIIAPKQTTNDSVDTLNFFRNNTDARSMDFSTGRTGLEFHCCPINSDDYTILKHRRYVLTTTGAPTGIYNRQSGSSWINLNWYIKLNRQIRYLPGESSTPTDGRVFHVFWFDNWGATSGTAAAACATVSSKVIAYFREPRN